MNAILRFAKYLPKTAPVSCSYLIPYAVVRQVRKFSTEVEKSQNAKWKKNETTIFDKIISKELKPEILYEDDKCMAFNDINPQAPVHFLVIPKRRIPMLNDSSTKDAELLGHLILTAKTLAKNRAPEGYRLVINNGVHGCQSVYHLHIHIVGGRQLTWPPG